VFKDFFTSHGELRSSPERDEWRRIFVQESASESLDWQLLGGMRTAPMVANSSMIGKVRELCKKLVYSGIEVLAVFEWITLAKNKLCRQ
jgi:hypothetical protein